MATARRIGPCARMTAAISPKIISEKYSGERNDKASDARMGEKPAMTPVEIVPAKSEARAATASATPALPCCAILWPSMAVTTAEASPGRLISMAVVDPPYWAP